METQTYNHIIVERMYAVRMSPDKFMRLTDKLREWFVMNGGKEIYVPVREERGKKNSGKFRVDQ